MYAEARQDQADHYAQRIVDIAMEPNRASG